MTRLLFFIITGSLELEELPCHITNQASLTELECGIERLKEVPVNIGQLRKLRSLQISSRLLTSLPISLGDMSSLTSLGIDGCGELECLPTSIGDLSSLTSLEITRCGKLESLPESFGRLQLLENLRIESVGVKSLPKSFGQLINLQKLYISECRISELHLEAGLFTCLKEIELWSTDVAKISISTDLPQLEWLDIDDNRHLKEIEALPNALQTLSLRRCPKLNVLPSLAQLASLEELKITGCCGVEKLAGLEHCGATERFRKVEIQTTRGSGFEGFIESMKKCPREYIAVCTPAVGDAGTILNSFAFPNLSLIRSFANQKANTDLSFEWPSTAPCIFLCFVLSCTSPKTKLQLWFSGNYLVWNWMELEERGKWVWTALLTQHALNNGFMSGHVQGRVRIDKRGMPGIFEVEVEGGVVVVGEEESAWEAFTHLSLALAN